MNKILLFTLAIYCLTLNIQADEAWVSQTSGTTDSLFGVRFTSASTGYAVGSKGGIFKTTNGGTAWTAQNSGTTNNFHNIFFTDSLTGYAVAHVGTIVKTVNGGTTWTAQTSGTTNILYSVYFPSATIGYASGNTGTILKTINSGSTWTTLTSGTTNMILGSYFTDVNTGYVVGASGMIRKTTDGGTTWTTQTSGTTNLFYAVYFTDANTGYAVGGNGAIVKTVNGGTTWTAQTSGTNNNLGCVYFLTATTGFAVGNNGTVLKTINGGTTWTSQTSGTTVMLYGVYFSDTANGTAVGNSGAIIKHGYTPGAPTGVVGSQGNAQVSVSWTAPVSTGSAPITFYIVTASPGSASCATTGATSCTVTGLTNGTAYTFTVKASNASGSSAASSPSAAVTPGIATVPGAPTNVTGISGNAFVTVSWVAPSSTGGSTILQYTAVAKTSPGGVAGGTPCTWLTGPLTCNVTGLTNGTAYTFTVTATNSTGTSAASSASSAVTPQAPPFFYKVASPSYATSVTITPDTPSFSGGTLSNYQATPTLPSGLSLNGTTGIITGAPTTAQAATNYVITASSNGGTVTASLSITVLTQPTAVFYPVSPALFGLNVSVTPDVPIVRGGTATAFSISPALPSGLNFNTATGAISGAPTTLQGLITYTITASNTAGSVTGLLSLSVVTPPSSFSYSVQNANYLQDSSITPDIPSITGTVTVFSSTPDLPDGLTLDMTTGIITGAPTASAPLATYAITASNPAGFATTYINITINDPAALKSIASLRLQIKPANWVDVRGRTIGMKKSTSAAYDYSASREAISKLPQQ